MVGGAIPGGLPATSVDEAIARMQQIEAALPSHDGVACFNRMYLEVTQQVNSRIGQGFFSDPGYMAHLDVVFANIYFSALDAIGNQPTNLPGAWEPLIHARADKDLSPFSSRSLE
jgi:hypothetical protein